MSGVHLPMSSSTSPSSTANSSTDDYGQLLKVYNAAKVNSDADTSNGRTLVQKELALLPEQVLNSIYKNYAICDPNSSDNDAEWEGWGKTHVLDSLSTLLCAIEAIARITFSSLQTDQKTFVTKRKCIHSESSRNSGWSKNDTEILLQSLDDYFTSDLTPELQTKLDKWATKGSPGEQRNKAAEKITTFLTNKLETRLFLSNYNLSSLLHIFNKINFPDRFNFPDRLEILSLSENYLTRVPKAIRILSALTDLDLGYNKLKKLPSEICKLSALRFLNVSHNMLKKLPKTIHKLSMLTAADVSYNKLTELPWTICKLPELSMLDARDNQLKDPAIIRTLQNKLQTNGMCELYILNNPNLLLHPEPTCPSILGCGLNRCLKNFEYVPSHPTI